MASWPRARRQRSPRAGSPHLPSGGPGTSAPEPRGSAPKRSARSPRRGAESSRAGLVGSPRPPSPHHEGEQAAVTALLAPRAQPRAERVQADADGEDQRVDDEVRRHDVVGVLRVHDDGLDREDHGPHGRGRIRRARARPDEVAERPGDEECGDQFHAAQSTAARRPCRRPVRRTSGHPAEVRRPASSAACRRQPPRAGPGLEHAAERLHALAHAREAETGTGLRQRRRARRPPRRAPRSPAPRAWTSSRTPDLRAGRVLHRVGQSLLHDAVRAVRQLGATVGRRPAAAWTSRRPAAVRLVEQRVAAAPRRSSPAPQSSNVDQPIDRPAPRCPASRIPAKRVRGAGRRAIRPAPAWMTITARWCATMSCSSRAIRARSRRTAAARARPARPRAARLRSSSAATSCWRERTRRAGGPRRRRGEERRARRDRPRSPAPPRAARPRGRRRAATRQRAAARALTDADRATATSGGRQPCRPRPAGGCATRTPRRRSRSRVKLPAVRRDALACRGERRLAPSAVGSAPRTSSSSASGR